jgi:hypothetical protein
MAAGSSRFFRPALVQLEAREVPAVSGIIALRIAASLAARPVAVHAAVQHLPPVPVGASSPSAAGITVPGASFSHLTIVANQFDNVNMLGTHPTGFPTFPFAYSHVIKS